MKTLNKKIKFPKIENELIIYKHTIVKDPYSLANPKISIGILPFYNWSKIKKPTIIISTRYLDCRMLAYGNYKEVALLETTDIKEAKKLFNKLVKS